MPTEYQRYRVLWPLVPAMAMVMIDFTIVSISASTIQSRPPPLRDGDAVAGHRLRALDRGIRRPRRPTRRHLRPPANSHHRHLHLRRRLADVRAGPGLEQHLRGMADLLPRPPGRRWRPPGALGDGPRARRLRSVRARQGPLGLLHRRRAVHRDRPGRRLLPDRVLDLAGDLLDQRPSRAALPGRVPLRQTQRRQTPGEARRPGRGPDRRRHGPDRARDPAVDRMGLGQPGDDPLDRGRPRGPRLLRQRRAPHRGPADRRQRAAREQAVRDRPGADLPRLRPLARRLLLRLGLLPGRGRPGTDPGRLLDPDDVLLILRRLADRRRLDGQGRREETGLDRLPPRGRSG